MGIYFTKTLLEVERVVNGKVEKLNDEEETQDNDQTEDTEGDNQEEEDNTDNNEDDVETNDYSLDNDEEDVEDDNNDQEDNTDDNEDDADNEDGTETNDYNLEDDNDEEETQDNDQEDNTDDNEDDAETNDYSLDNDEEDNDGNEDEETDNQGYTPSELQDLEKELFVGLTQEQINIKVMELKNQYIEVYNTTINIINRLNKTTKTTSNIKILEFIIKKLMQLKELIYFYLANTFDTKSYIENSINYQEYLAILNTVNKILDQIKMQNEDKNA